MKKKLLIINDLNVYFSLKSMSFMEMYTCTTVTVTQVIKKGN